jgi:hypothetical protein
MVAIVKGFFSKHVPTFNGYRFVHKVDTCILYNISAKNNKTTHLFFMSIWLYHKKMDNSHKWTLRDQN